MATKKIDYRGFTCEVDMDIFDDVEFFKLSDELETKPSKNIDVLKMGLGAEKYEEFEKYFKKKDGRLKMSVVAEMVLEIFKEADPKA